MSRLILAAGLLATIAGAQAKCPSPVDGFFGTVKVGYGVTNVRDKITTQKTKITGNKNYRKLQGGVSITDGNAVKSLSEEECKLRNLWSAKLAEYNNLRNGKISDAQSDDNAEGFDAANFYAVLNEFTQAGQNDANPKFIIKFDEDLIKRMNEEKQNAAEQFKNRLSKMDEEFKDLGISFRIDDKEVKLADMENLYIYSLDETGAADPGDLHGSAAGVYYKIPEGKALDIIYEGQVLSSYNADIIGPAYGDPNVIPTEKGQDTGIMLCSVPEFSTIEEDETKKGTELLERKLADFKAKILGIAMNAKYGKTTLSPARLAEIASKEQYTEELKAATKEIKSHKNNMNIGLSVGYQHAFGVLYTAVELGAEFVPGRVKIQNISVDGHKVHRLGNCDFTYEKAIARAVPEISLKTKYNFEFTPMLGINAYNWAFYIPITLKLTKYELNVTPSSTFANAKLASVSYPETTADRVGPYTLSNVKVTTADNKTASVKNKTNKTKAKNLSAYKQGKTRVGFEIGAGARVAVSRNVFVDLRYTYSPRTSFKVNTPAYRASNALHDLNRLGTKHNVGVSSHKGMIGIGYKF